MGAAKFSETLVPIYKYLSLYIP